jgi:hypothetical protein
LGRLRLLIAIAWEKGVGIVAGKTRDPGGFRFAGSAAH